MKKTILFLFIILNYAVQAQNIKIAAAPNLRYVLDELKASFEKQNPQIHLLVTFGSSGTLYQQITNGADFDVFMSADRTFPEKLKADGNVNGDVNVYAYGKLVLWSNTIDLKSQSINVLLKSEVVHIAIAKPEVAPYGERAIECLKYYQMLDKVKNKIVYADNISQTAQYAQSGNAQIGFLALSLALAPEMKGSYLLLDTKSYKPVDQGIVALKGSKNKDATEKFIKFILSKGCKPIFEKNGYTFP